MTDTPPRIVLPAPGPTAFTTPVLRGPKGGDGEPGIQGPPGDGGLIAAEVPTGTRNGSNTTFTLANAFQTGSTSVYRNGVLEQPTVGYTESSPQIIFTTAPLGDDVITVSYVVNGS